MKDLNPQRAFIFRIVHIANVPWILDHGGLHCQSSATFQELLQKSLEIRVTVVGRRVMSASIDSQVSARAAHDWRRDGLRMLQDWRPYQLPQEIEEKILRLMDYFCLNYGAIDIILTPDDQHVFLELNPGGEFFWLERTPGLPISDAIADVLLGHCARRESTELTF